jgi:site-specific recombinase
MTAAYLAQDIERGERGKANQKRLALMLVDLIRSQFAAVMGNVLVAVSLAFVIAWLYPYWQGSPLLSSEAVAYQLKAVSPLEGLALWYAAIAGVWLFCSGLVAGYFDNRAAYLTCANACCTTRCCGVCCPLTSGVVESPVTCTRTTAR